MEYALSRVHSMYTSLQPQHSTAQQPLNLINYLRMKKVVEKEKKIIAFFPFTRFSFLIFLLLFFPTVAAGSAAVIVCCCCFSYNLPV